MRHRTVAPHGRATNGSARFCRARSRRLSGLLVGSRRSLRPRRFYGTGCKVPPNGRQKRPSAIVRVPPYSFKEPASATNPSVPTSWV